MTSDCGSNAYEIGSLAVTVATTSVTGDVGGDGDGSPVGAGASSINHAGVRTSTVGVDLVKGHGERATSADLGKSRAHGSHDGRGA